MANAQVILKEKIEGLGAEADVVKVRAGYARNFLIPQGKAFEANRSNLRHVEALKASRAAREAEELVGLFSPLGAVTASAFDAVTGEFDLVLNATSASMSGEVPPVPPTVIGERTVCYDMSYGTGDTAFTLWAKGYGASLAVTGWGMLVEQAAEAFFLWRGVRPQTRPVLDAIKKPMPGKKG